MSRPFRVLAVDHEGGHGGSSRSLFLALSHMDRTGLELEVWCRRPSALVDAYQRLGIRCQLIPELPLFRAHRTALYTARQYLAAVRARSAHRALLNGLAERIRSDFDLVHFNYESLGYLASWLRPKVRTPFTLHLRTRPYATSWARRQCHRFGGLFERLVFITENERDTFSGLGGDISRGEVVFNPAPDDVPASPIVPPDDRITLAFLGTATYERGIDRTVELARVLFVRGVSSRFRFLIAGDMQFSRGDPGILGELARLNLPFIHYAKTRDVGGMFKLLGHVPNPQDVVAASDIVLKVGRRNEPWGRDVIEALTYRRPVLATGTWDGFVRPGESGWLLGDFDADRCADVLLDAANQRERLRQMGEAGRRHILTVCDPAGRAADLLGIWRAAAAARQAA